MRLAYIGNFEPEFSTENEILHALGVLGHEVTPVQEQVIHDWGNLLIAIKRGELDLVLWTSTRGLATQVGFEPQWQMLDTARRYKVPTVAIHLDRWWGLDREHQLESPFFSCQHVYTADGGHQAEFESIGVNHTWFPPAISERWCQPGTPRPEYECDVLFVGSWQGGYHKEWMHRAELVDFLARTYGDRFLALPRRGRPAIRGLELNDVYWSAKVVVGDSCLVPKADRSPMTHYCSDRIPETLGRGGILLHPSVYGVDQVFGDHFLWALGDWADLRETIDALLHEEGWVAGSRDNHRLQQIEHMKREHTYTSRMEWVLKEVTES